MPRSRKIKNSAPRRLLAVAAGLAILSWGLWQWRALYAAILQDTRPAGGAADTRRLPPNSAQALVDASPAPTEAPVDSDGAAEQAHAPQGSAGAPQSILPDHEEDVSTETLASRGREIDLLMEAAEQAADAGDLLLQREKLNQALALIGESARAPEVREQLAAINSGIFLDSDVVVQDNYAPLISIEAGDTFTRLAHRYRLTPELLAALNPQLAARDLHPGTGIKIVYGPFHARVVKHDLRLDLYDRDMYVRSFHIQLDDGNFLPVGTYRVRSQGRIRVASAESGPTHDWIAWEPLGSGSGGIQEGWFYGSAGARGRSGNLGGARLDDSDLHTVYNALVERDSLVRVDP